MSMRLLNNMEISNLNPLFETLWEIIKNKQYKQSRPGKIIYLCGKKNSNLFHFVKALKEQYPEQIRELTDVWQNS